MSGTAQIPQSLPEGSRVSPAISELYRKSGGGELGLSEQEFARILGEVAGKYPDAAERDLLRLYRSLRVEELALARACAAGNERAWEIFLTRYREKLHGAARGITRDDASARELADSLYADLYGTEEREGRRRSKLDYYTGRGSLEGWLRATLAQEYVNRYRRQHRLVSLEEKTEEGAQFPAAEPPVAQVPDPRLAQAADAVLTALAAEERFILASYYLDGCKLAQIARTLNLHESTISRKLTQIVRSVQQRLMDELLRRGMSRRQAEEALETDVRDVTVDVAGRISQDRAPAAFLKKGADPK